jgi:hypothetical protein
LIARPVACSLRQDWHASPFLALLKQRFSFTLNRMLSRIRVFATVSLFLSLAVVRIHADAVDTFLAQPIPSKVTPQAVKDLIKEGETLAAGAPQRRLEVEAYLIPLRRLIPAEDAKTAASKSKLLLLLSNGTALELLRAQSFSKQGNALIVIGMDGQRSVWQQDLLKKQLPWYSDEDLASGSIDLAPVILEYDKALMLHPTAPAALKEELDKMRRIEKDLAEKKARKRTEISAKLDALLGQTYIPEKKYSREELARFLLDAEAVRSEAGPQLAELDKKIALFRRHFLNILADMTFENGAWWTPIQRTTRQQAQEDRTRFAQFAQEHKWPLESSLPPSPTLTYTLGASALLLLVILFKIGQGIWRAGSTKSRIYEIIGFTAVLAVPAYLGLGLTASPPELAPVSVVDPAANPAVRLLYLCRQENPAVIPGVEETLVITDQDINALFQQSIQWTAADPSQPVRTGLNIHWIHNGIQIQETWSWKNQTFTARYVATVQRSKEGDDWRLISLHVGNIALTDPFRSYLWENLQNQLLFLVLQPPVGSWYRWETIAEGQIELKALFKPSSPALPKVSTESGSPAKS